MADNPLKNTPITAAVHRHFDPVIDELYARHRQSLGYEGPATEEEADTTYKAFRSGALAVLLDMATGTIRRRHGLDRRIERVRGKADELLSMLAKERRRKAGRGELT